MSKTKRHVPFWVKPAEQDDTTRWKLNMLRRLRGQDGASPKEKSADFALSVVEDSFAVKRDTWSTTQSSRHVRNAKRALKSRLRQRYRQLRNLFPDTEPEGEAPDE